MSSITDWASGISPAPNTPCNSRKPTICPIVWAIPHSIEATVKPMAATMNSLLRPNRLAAQPTGAVMIAEATM